MDAITRRTYSGRIPGLAALLVLALMSFIFTTSPVQGDYLVNRFQRRGTLAWRQEDSPAPAANGTASGSAVISSTSISTISVESTTSRTIPVSSETTSTTTTHITSSVSTTSTRVSSTPTTAVSAVSPTSRSISASERPVTTSSKSLPPVTSTITQARQSGTTVEPVPQTTLTMAAAIVPTFTTTQTSTQSDPSPTSSLESVGGSSKGFWANKGAVAATFVILSLIIVGVAGVVLLNFFKKRSAARQRRIHAGLFAKYSDTVSPNTSIDHTQRTEVVYDDSRFQGATVTSAYPFSGSGFAVSSSSPAPQDQYPAPPNSSGSQASHHTAYYTPEASQQSLSVPQPSKFSTTAPQRDHYILPSQAQAAFSSNYSHSAPLVAYREPNARGSYQQSIDSFYGYYNSNNTAAGP